MGGIAPSAYALRRAIGLPQRAVTLKAVARVSVRDSLEQDGLVISFLICASARTGTNLLATALRRTGVAGWPFEYFSAELANQPFMLSRLGNIAASAGAPDFAARLPLIIRAGSTDNGVFGSTVHWVQMKNLMAAIGHAGEPILPPSPDAVASLSASFPGLRFIQLTRQNTVAQAISHYRAMKTGRWSELAREPAAAAPVDLPFDEATILRLKQGAETDAAGWEAFLAGRPEPKLALTYEALSADFHETIRRVLEFLDIRASEVNIPPPNFRRQADALSLEWEDRIRGIPAQGGTGT
jgi:LPS sulfotransferase NodH